MARSNAQLWAACLALLALTAQHGALAGLIIASDNSDLCNSNLKDCKQRCPAPQSFLFMCSSGGTFSKPNSDCKCVTVAPAGVVTDGTAIFQMTQWPGTEACQGNTWLYDCAQYLTLQAGNNQMQGQALDQASALAAINAANQAAAQQAAAAAQQAAASAQSQQGGQSQQQQGGAASGGMAPASAMGASPSGVPGLDTGASGVPGLAPAGGMSGGSSMGSGSGSMSGGMGGAGAGVGAGMGGGAGAGMGGMGGAGAGAGMMGGSPAMPGASLMGSNFMGHRHLLQFDGPPPTPAALMGAGAGPSMGVGMGGAGGLGGGMGGAGAGMAGAGSAGMGVGAGLGAGAGAMRGAGAGMSAAATPSAIPSATLQPACQKSLQGMSTAANTGILVVPNFKGIATMQTRGNDTLFIQLGGQGSNCVAGYKLAGGKVLDLGRTKEELKQQADATKKSAAGGVAPGAWAAGLAALLAGALLL